MLALLALFVFLCAISAAVGWSEQRSIEQERVVASRLDYQDWLAQAPKHPHDAAHQGLHVFKPPAPLSMVDPGLTPYLGSTLWLQAHRQSDVRFRPATDATGLKRFGTLSVAWIIQVLGPLMILVMGFGLYASEREQGLLRQTLALGVAPSRLAAGKALALISVAALLVAPLLFAGLWAAWNVLGSTSQSYGEVVLRTLGLTGSSFVYLLAWALVVLAVSAWARQARVAIVVLLLGWIAATIAAPRLSADVVRLMLPTPTREGFTTSLDQAMQKSHQAAWLKELGSSTRWGAELPLSQWGKALRVDDQAGYRALDEQFGALWDRFEAQQRVQQWAGIVAPLLAARSISMTLSGTDFAAHRAFAASAEQHRRRMQDLISHDLEKHADARGEQHFTYKAGRELWAQLPPYVPARVGLQQSLMQATPGLLALAAHLGLAFALWWVLAVRRLTP
jgi:ABC-2 type transport system permease protein